MRRTLSVVFAVAVTSTGVYGVVTVGGALGGGAILTASAELPGQTAVAQDSRVQTCPATGCTATSCHGATGAPPPASPQSSQRATDTNRSTTGGGGNGAPSSKPQNSGSQAAPLYVCPVSGCTATSCHGATGAPPPGSRTATQAPSRGTAHQAGASGSGGSGGSTKVYVCPETGCSATSCHHVDD